MTILVTGARGNIGGRLLTLLAEDGHRVRGSARNTSALRLPEGAEPAELDVTDPRGAEQALRGVETMFLYPTRGETGAFLRIAAEAGVRHVVLLSSPAAYEAGEYDRPIGLVHRAVERALEESGLRHTVLYPSWLATNARRDWAGEIRATGRVGIAHPDAQVNPVHIDDVAEVAARLLTEEAHRGRRQVLTGPRSMRLREVVAALGEAVGAPVEVEELTVEQALGRRDPRMPEPVLRTLLEVTASAVGVPAPVTNTVERITGHPAREFAEWASANRADFR
ncbi:NAD(P)H-binding protein [Streptosporangium sp. NPDC020145]|uniref:NAD(P)H-binding protein n=1 Tax=Streptosporangium sp. NPDC020145 TaxID=3154694 RepID=UPI003444F212